MGLTHLGPEASISSTIVAFTLSNQFVIRLLNKNTIINVVDIIIRCRTINVFNYI